MGHLELVRLKPVVAEEKPSAKLLIDRMEPIANCCLRDLREDRLREPQEQFLESSGLFELGAEIDFFHSE